MDMSNDIIANVNVRVEWIETHTGNVIFEEVTHNRVTNVGLNLLRDLISGEAGDTVTHVGFGTGTTPVSAGDTALVNEVHRDAITLIDTASAATVQFRHFLSSSDANGHTITEAGLFTEASEGLLFARVLTTPLPKSDAISVNLYWQMTFAAVV